MPSTGLAARARRQLAPKQDRRRRRREHRSSTARCGRSRICAAMLGVAGARVVCRDSPGLARTGVRRSGRRAEPARRRAAAHASGRARPRGGTDPRSLLEPADVVGSCDAAAKRTPLGILRDRKSGASRFPVCARKKRRGAASPRPLETDTSVGFGRGASGTCLPKETTHGANREPPTLARRFPVVPGTRLYPPVPPLPVLSSLKPDHLLSAVAQHTHSKRMEVERRSTVGEPSTTDSSRPRSSGTVTLESDVSA